MGANARQYRMNILQFLFRGSLIAASYQTPLLRESGMDEITIGTVMAILSAMGMFSPPFFGYLADRMGSPRKVFLLIITGCAAIWGVMPFAMHIRLWGLSMSVFFMVGSSFFRMATNGLVDTWYLQLEEKHQDVAYGKARMYGSMGMAILSAVSTPIVATWGTSSIFLLLPICLLPMMILSRGIGDGGVPGRETMVKADAPHLEKGGVGKIFKNFYLTSFYLCGIGFLLHMQTDGAFMPFIVEKVTGDVSAMGLLMGVRSFMHIPSLLIAPYLVRKFSLKKVVMWSIFYYGFEQLLYGLSYQVWTLYLVMILSGSTFGLYLYTIVRMIYLLAPKNLSATAITIYEAVMAVSGVLGNFGGGVLLKYFGIRIYYFTASGVVFATTAIFFFSLWWGKRKGIPFPEAFSE